MKLTGKDGTLRIYDSSAILHGQAPLTDKTVDMVTFDGVATYANITTNVEADDANFESAFITDDNDIVYIGSTDRFAMIQYLLDAGSNYAVASGALIAKFYDGTDFNTALEGVADGTASGGDCFAQDGYITFKIPQDWATGADNFNANLDSDKYYVALLATTSPSTDPDADVLCPADGQYFDVAFEAMDFSGPLGRAKTEEQVVLDRNNMNANGHYIEGSDEPIYEPLPVTFSAMLDDTVNKDDILEAIECGNPGALRWTSTGVTSKATTQNDGSNNNPAFGDSTKKTVNIQIIWEGSTLHGWSFYEVFFPRQEQTISEAKDGVTFSLNGGCYGVIERIHGFGNRY